MLTLVAPAPKIVIVPERDTVPVTAILLGSTASMSVPLIPSVPGGAPAGAEIGRLKRTPGPVHDPELARMTSSLFPVRFDLMTSRGPVKRVPAVALPTEIPA